VDQANGTACSAVGAAAGAPGAAGAAGTLNGMFCTAGSCVMGRCGDGYVDALIAGEECDDANEVPRDGCEPTCKFTCSTAADCADGDACNGEETCDAHKCSPGTPVADALDLMCAPGKNCRSGQCVLVGCGNGTKEGAEECDDNNNVNSDGCQADCTYTCESNAECDDGNACTGLETCDMTVPTAPLCKPGTAVVCDEIECMTVACDRTQGTCKYSLIDADGDGEAPATLACGTDCNDDDRTVGKGMPEVCGDNKDNDCNPQTIDASQTTYYQDCDGDGFSERGGSYVVTCDPPGPSGKCGSGLADKWTVQPPDSSATIDCYDANPFVKPTQTAYKTTYISGVDLSVDFDYNCDKVEQPYFTAVGVATNASCTEGKGGCIGADGWVNAAVPECGVSGSYSDCGCASPIIIGFNQVTSAAILPGPTLGCTYGCARSVIKRVQSCR